MYELKRHKLGGRRLWGAVVALLVASLAGVALPSGASGAAATHFSVTASTPVTAGSNVSFTVTALDMSNATDTGYTGTVHFTSTDGQAVLPADSTLTNGVGNFQATLKTAGNQTITATDVVTASITGTSNNITVNPAAATHLSVSAPASVTAGTPFSFTVTALDPFGNTDTNYAPIVHFSSSDASATLPANSTLTSGTRTFTNGATLRRAGAQTISAAQLNLAVSGTSASIAVAAAPATHLGVAAPAAAQTGTAFGFTVSALDDFGNTDTAYGGTVHLTSTDGGATLPANSTLTMGSRSFSATLRTEGLQTISANDVGTPSINGTSAGITLSSATHFTVTGPAAATAGKAFTFTVTALNANGSVDSGYGDSVRFSSSDANADLPLDSTLSNGTGTFTATLRTTGSRTITVVDRGVPSVIGSSAAIQVSPSNSFSFGKLKLRPHSGTAILSVDVPGPGKLALGGRGIRHQRAAAGAASARARAVSEAGTVKLTVRAKGKAKRKLDRTGKVKVKAKVTFTPTGGAAHTDTKTVKLKEGP
jgi:hypothetical protein